MVANRKTTKKESKSNSKYKTSYENIKNEFKTMKLEMIKDLKNDPIKTTAIAFGVGFIISKLFRGCQGKPRCKCSKGRCQK